MQRSFPILSWLSLAVSAVLLAGCSLFSLAADITPPPDYTPEAPVIDAPAAVSTAFPLLSPDPAAGKAIFSEKCAPCHGESGLGDGAKAGSLPERPPLIGGQELALQARPADWFTTVTDGNLEKFMPGFSGSLDDRQRWDVVAYALTLSQTPAQLEMGKAVFSAQCAECHGENGEGGQNTANSSGQPAADWNKQDRLARLSALEIAAVIATGSGDMPAFSELSSEERLAAAVYVRNLTFARAGQESAAAEASASTPAAEATPADAAAATAAPEALEGELVISGQVTAQGEGLEVGGLEVTLLGYEGMTQALEETTTSAADGSYQFTVENKTGMAYMITVDALGYTFNSDILHSQDALVSPADLPVTIYASTADLSALSADRMHVFFDFSTPGTIQVVELFIFSNAGQAVIVSEDPAAPALSFSLPAGAENLQFDGGALGERFVATADGFADTAAIAPGQGGHQVLFSYTLPYDKKLSLSLPLPMAVDAAVVMMPQGGVRLQSEQLMDSGSRDVQGMTYELYTAANVSGTLAINLAGKAQSGAAAASGGTTTGLLIGAGVFGLALIGAGVWIFRARRQQQSSGADEAPEAGAVESEDSLLDAILTLDDLYQAGNLSEDAYQKRRAELKNRLKALKAG